MDIIEREGINKIYMNLGMDTIIDISIVSFVATMMCYRIINQLKK